MTKTKLQKIVEAYYVGGADAVAAVCSGEGRDAARILREIAKQAEAAAVAEEFEAGR